MRQSFARRFVLAAAIVVFSSAGAVLVAQAGDFVQPNDSDFDCDGVRDSVSADTSATVNGDPGAGAVTVTMSSAGRLVITQDTEGVPGVAEPRDGFGWAYAAYDRNKDGCDDLVIGAPFEDAGPTKDTGIAYLIPGSSAAGLATAQTKVLEQGSGGLPGVPEAGDLFGSMMAAGATSTGIPFLIIGASGESRGSIRESGVIYYIRPDVVAAFDQSLRGLATDPWYGEDFGSTIAASDRHFAVSAPGEQVDQGSDGLVHVFSHTLFEGRPKPIANISQNSPGISGVAEAEDYFGDALSVLPYQPSSSSAVGALVAVGSPGEDIGSVDRAGMSHLIYVSATGGVSELLAVNQGTSGVSSSPEPWDVFGSATVLANLDPTAKAATPQTAVWVVGVPGESTHYTYRGAVHVFRPGWRPGQNDITVDPGEYGLRSDPSYAPIWIRATSGHFQLASNGSSDVMECNWVPWANILNGASEPVLVKPDDCGRH
ncbi:MAG: integrin alpha [Micromonosporaceae bacterium]